MIQIQHPTGIRKINVANCEREDLLALLEYTVNKLEEKDFKLRTTRVKLRAMKMRISKMKDIVHYQREKIIQLYGMNATTALKRSA